MRRIYLNDLFPKGEVAQVPYLYAESFSEQLNKIMAEGIAKKDQRGIYYEIDE